MGVSTVDGTIEEVEHGRRAAGVRFFKKIVFRLDGGKTKTVAKAVVHSDLAEQLVPGRTGRFYLFTAVDHRGVHGFRDANGAEMLRFPKNNERIGMVVGLAMGAWVAAALIFLGGIPILPTIAVIIGVPLYFLMRKTRLEAERQFAADSGHRPLVAA